jgi:hypothetical protein
MANNDNALYNSMVGHIQVGSDIKSDKIIDKCASIGDVINNLGVRLKDETLKQIDTIKNTSGELRQSYDFRVKVFGESFEVQIYLADYYDYVNKGVRGAGGLRKTENGKYLKSGPSQAWKIKSVDSPYFYSNKRPPLSPLKKWLNNKGLKYNPFAVQESIFRKGIKGNKFWIKVVDDATNGEINRELIKDLINAGATGYSDGMNEIFDDLK